MSLKNSAGLRVTECGQSRLRGLEDSDGKETGEAEQGNPHRGRPPKPPSLTPVNSNEPLMHSQLTQDLTFLGTVTSCQGGSLA